jgi:hypothetical protein
MAPDREDEAQSKRPGKQLKCMAGCLSFSNQICEQRKELIQKSFLYPKEKSRKRGDFKNWPESLELK